MLELPIRNRTERYTVAPGKIIALGQNYRDHNTVADERLTPDSTTV